MPFPLSFVRLFSDFNGQFVLLVLCLGCRHERAIKAAVIARRFGTDALVASTVRRLRCSKCGQRNVDVLIGGIPASAKQKRGTGRCHPMPQSPPSRAPQQAVSCMR